MILVNGIEVYESTWHETMREVGRRATFELDCPDESLEFVLIRKLVRQPSEVGVRGCGRREVYTRVGTTWFSSGQGEAATAQQQLIDQQRRQQQQQQRQ